MKKHTIGKGYSIRWGGEEFLMVFENMNLSQTLTIVEAIQEELRKYIHLLDEKQLHVTMTFGVVQNSHTEIKEMIKQADVLLYKGKEQGRNRIIS
jgi:diguanylate cyclase (GGDEF)-like protein